MREREREKKRIGKWIEVDEIIHFLRRCARLWNLAHLFVSIMNSSTDLLTPWSCCNTQKRPVFPYCSLLFPHRAECCITLALIQELCLCSSLSLSHAKDFFRFSIFVPFYIGGETKKKICGKSCGIDLANNGIVCAALKIYLKQVDQHKMYVLHIKRIFLSCFFLSPLSLFVWSAYHSALSFQITANLNHYWFT